MSSTLGQARDALAGTAQGNLLCSALGVWSLVEGITTSSASALAQLASSAHCCLSQTPLCLCVCVCRLRNPQKMEDSDPQRMCVNSLCPPGITKEHMPWGHRGESCELCLPWSHTWASVLELSLEEKQVEEAWKGFLGRGHCIGESMVNP